MRFFTATIASLACAATVLGAAVELEPRAALIATNAYAACHCPNNCSYKKGHSCKYYSGPSNNSPVVSGHCAHPNGNPGSEIECIAQ